MSDTNRAVRSQKMAIKEDKRFTIRVAKTNVLGSYSGSILSSPFLSRDSGTTFCSSVANLSPRNYGEITIRQIRDIRTNGVRLSRNVFEIKCEHFDGD